MVRPARGTCGEEQGARRDKHGDGSGERIRKRREVRVQGPDCKRKDLLVRKRGGGRAFPRFDEKGGGWLQDAGGGKGAGLGFGG